MMSLSSPGLHLFSSKSPTSRTHTGSSYLKVEKRANEVSGKSRQDDIASNESGQAETSRPPAQVEGKIAAAERSGTQEPQEPELDKEEPPTKNESVEDGGDAPAEDNRPDETDVETTDASVSQEITQPVDDGENSLKDANGEDIPPAAVDKETAAVDETKKELDEADGKDKSEVELSEETNLADDEEAAPKGGDMNADETRSIEAVDAIPVTDDEDTTPEEDANAKEASPIEAGEGDVPLAGDEEPAPKGDSNTDESDHQPAEAGEDNVTEDEAKAEENEPVGGESSDPAEAKTTSTGKKGKKKNRKKKKGKK